MLGLLIALYGFYLVAVGYHGNAGKLFDDLKQEKQFVYWLIAIVILYALWQVDSLKPIIKPFIVLALISTALFQYENIKAQVDSIKQEFNL